MREVDAQRQLQLEADQARANEAFAGAATQESRQGTVEVPQKLYCYGHPS